MNKRELNNLEKELSQRLAHIKGFNKVSTGLYVEKCINHERHFWLDSKLTAGVGEFTLNIGIVVPALKSIVTLVPGSEKENWPCFGGPVFRFANLSESKLHDFIVKVDTVAAVEEGLQQISSVWESVAGPFFNQLASPADWAHAFNNFIDNNQIGSLHVPVVGRLCVAWWHAALGFLEAERVLGILSTRGAGGRPVQDFDQALELHGILTENPSYVAPLADIIAR